MKRSTLNTLFQFFFGTSTLFMLATAASAAPVTRRAQGANAAAIQATVDQFRADLGGVNNGVGGSYANGRREINWDSVPDNLASPGSFPRNYYNFVEPRGVVVSSPCNTGSIFQVSADSSNPTGTPVRYGHIDPSYTTTFTTFSAERLLSTGGNCNITVVNFFIPGTNIPATVGGFGVVFTDVDSGDVVESTRIIPFDKSGNVMAGSGSPTLIAVPFNGGLSFVGVSFNAGERIASVHIVSGNESLDVGTLDNVNGVDLVVMDDFIYGEPRAAEFHAGDVDGDGVADARVFRPATATWYTLNSGSNTVSIAPFGANGDIPVDGDFDGDSRADLCIFRPSNGQWWFLRSSNASVYAATFGQSGDNPVAGDYDKDGKTDIAVWRQSNGNYYVLRSSANFGSFYAFPFGQNGDIPVE
jgi:hypothetical protein